MPTDRELEYDELNTEGEQIDTDKAAVFANSAAVNTVVNVAIAAGKSRRDRTKFVVIVRNPSAVTALTVRVRAVETALGGATRYPELATLAVPANTPDGKALVFEGYVSGGLRVSVSNDTVLGVADGFTADVRVRGL